MAKNNLLSTILGGVAGAAPLVGGILSNIGAQGRQDRANQQNIDFWNMQNKYNHPSQQMSRLRKAGLNPNLIYGGSPASATGQADKIAPSKASPYQHELGDPMSKLLMHADIKLREAQTSNQEAGATAQTQNALLSQMKSRQTKEETRQLRGLYNGSLEVQKWDIKNRMQEAYGKFIDNNIKHQGTADLVKEIKERAELAKQNTNIAKRNYEIKKLELELSKLGVQRGSTIWQSIIGVIQKGHKNFNSFVPNNLKH